MSTAVLIVPHGRYTTREHDQCLFIVLEGLEKTDGMLCFLPQDEV